MAELFDERERDRVLRAFFEEGRLKALPIKMKKRRYALDVFARRFDPGREYTEKEVNDLISPVYGDYCTIRRELADFGFMARDRGVYHRLRGDGWLPEL